MKNCVCHCHCVIHGLGQGWSQPPYLVNGSSRRAGGRGRGRWFWRGQTRRMAFVNPVLSHLPLTTWPISSCLPPVVPTVPGPSRAAPLATCPPATCLVPPLTQYGSSESISDLGHGVHGGPGHGPSPSQAEVAAALTLAPQLGWGWSQSWSSSPATAVSPAPFWGCTPQSPLHAPTHTTVSPMLGSPSPTS